MQWMRLVLLLFISGTVYAGPDTAMSNNKPPPESALPNLGSQQAQQEEQESNGQSLKEQGADYFIGSATQGFENLTPEALESQIRSYLQGQVTSGAQSLIEDAMSPFGKVRSNLSLGQDGDLDGSSLDYFVPLYDNQQTVLFG